ncbi:MAG TPA: hypothetical protein VKE74_11550, partial [Gemmataceae bacterium]|nr:hypothetical protein [Gemmataceae bacterium]
PRPTARPRYEDDEDDDQPRRRRRRDDDDDDDDEDDRPRRKRRRREDDDEDRSRRDEDDEDDDEEDEEEERRRKRKQRRREEDEKLSPEERRAIRAQFARGMWGCRLLQISLGLYAFSFLLVNCYSGFEAMQWPLPALLVIAGVLGLANWILGAVGIGLCIAGRPSPGHYAFGISAAVAVVAHAIILCTVLSRTTADTVALNVERNDDIAVWAQIPTQQHVLTFYMAVVVYPDERLLGKSGVGLGLMAGVAEVMRLMLIMLTVSCLARAAGEEEIAYRCNRSAGIGVFGPGLMGVAMLCLVVLLVESGGIDRAIGKILLTVFVSGIYTILAGMLVPAALACRETADACEFPFESDRTRLDP